MWEIRPKLHQAEHLTLICAKPKWTPVVQFVTGRLGDPTNSAGVLSTSWNISRGQGSFLSCAFLDVVYYIFFFVSYTEDFWLLRSLRQCQALVELFERRFHWTGQTYGDQQPSLDGVHQGFGKMYNECLPKMGWTKGVPSMTKRRVRVILKGGMVGHINLDIWYLCR